MPPRLVIFDFDGTLADSFDWFLRAYDEIAAELGLRRIVPKDVPALRCLAPRALMRHFGVPGWRVPQLALRLRALQARDIGQIRLFEGIEEVIRSLPTLGTELAIVTSNAEANVRHVLGPALTSRIARFACGVPILGKASRLRKVLRAGGVAPGEALAIGDELRDLDAARNAAIPFGAVTWGYADPGALRAGHPTLIFDRPADILGCFTTATMDGPAGV